MYHGTSREAAREIEANGFQPSGHGMLGSGVYASRAFPSAALRLIQKLVKGCQVGEIIHSLSISGDVTYLPRLVLTSGVLPVKLKSFVLFYMFFHA